MKKFFKKLLKFLIIDETYNVSSNIGVEKYIHMQQYKWIYGGLNTHELLSKGHLAWCPARNYDSRLYTLIHHMQ